MTGKHYCSAASLHSLDEARPSKRRGGTFEDRAYETFTRRVRPFPRTLMPVCCIAPPHERSLLWIFNRLLRATIPCPAGQMSACARRGPSFLRSVASPPVSPFRKQSTHDRLALDLRPCRSHRTDHRVHRGLRTRLRNSAMPLPELIAALTAAGLLVYLVVVLLRPERF